MSFPVAIFYLLRRGGQMRIRHNNTANDKFKSRYERFLLDALILSTFAHFMFVIGTPLNMKSNVEMPVVIPLVLELPPEIAIPAPPDKLAKPVVSTIEIPRIEPEITFDSDKVIPDEMYEVEKPGDIIEMATPVANLVLGTVYPKVKHKPDLPAIPTYIARHKVDTVTRVQFYVNRWGEVEIDRTQIQDSSGILELDQLAQEYVNELAFHPARNGGDPVDVCMSLTIYWRSDYRYRTPHRVAPKTTLEWIKLA